MAWLVLFPFIDDLDLTPAEEEKERARLEHERRRTEKDQRFGRWDRPSRAGLGQMEWRDGALRSSGSPKLKW